jgi:hypothetical protein
MEPIVGMIPLLPDPDVLAREIMEELEAALEQFAGIVEELGVEES